MAWGYIRFVCHGCGERFWCRLVDNPHAAKRCYECESAASRVSEVAGNVGRPNSRDFGSRAGGFAFRSDLSDTAQHTHE
jgi:hypothetical protein